MRLLLSSDTAEQLRCELARAGRREIGGILMGEHVGPDLFRVCGITVQQGGGSAVCFMRSPHVHNQALKRFFDRTGHCYERFNYLGEWHSHPSFALTPSGPDQKTMHQLVSAGGLGVSFAVLMIVHLDSTGALQAAATAFSRGVPMMPVLLTVEEGDESAADRMNTDPP